MLLEPVAARSPARLARPAPGEGASPARRCSPWPSASPAPRPCSRSSRACCCARCRSASRTGCSSPGRSSPRRAPRTGRSGRPTIDAIGRESRVLESVAGVSYYEHPSPFAVVENGVREHDQRRGRHRRLLPRARRRSRSWAARSNRADDVVGRRERARDHPRPVAAPLRRLARRDRTPAERERAAVHDRGRDAAGRRVPARRRGVDDGGRAARRR